MNNFRNFVRVSKIVPGETATGIVRCRAVTGGNLAQAEIGTGCGMLGYLSCGLWHAASLACRLFACWFCHDVPVMPGLWHSRCLKCRLSGMPCVSVLKLYFFLVTRSLATPVSRTPSIVLRVSGIPRIWLPCLWNFGSLECRL